MSEALKELTEKYEEFPRSIGIMVSTKSIKGIIDEIAGYREALRKSKAVAEELLRADKESRCSYMDADDIIIAVDEVLK